MPFPGENMLVCFHCQRMMTEIGTSDIYICRYCGAVNFKIATEHTAFTVGWYDAYKVQDVNNIPVMYFTSPEQEEPEPEPPEINGDSGDNGD